MKILSYHYPSVFHSIKTEWYCIIQNNINEEKYFSCQLIVVDPMLKIWRGYNIYISKDLMISIENIWILNCNIPRHLMYGSGSTAGSAGEWRTKILTANVWIKSLSFSVKLWRVSSCYDKIRRKIRMK